MIMKRSTVFLVFLLCFAILHPIAARIVRTEEATALIETTAASTDAPSADTNSTTPATTTTEKTPKSADKKPATKKPKHVRTQKKHAKSTAATVTAPQPAAPAEAKPAQPTDMLDAKIKQIQEESEKEIASIKAQNEKKVTIIKRQEELKKLAEQQKALADELAKLDDKAAEKAPEKPAPTAVTTEWKVEQTAKFNRYSTELADTIAMGESDDAELQDFKHIFKDQQQWFDTTLTSTKYVSDEGYAAINERTKCLGLLVTAQKRATPLLMKEINMKKISKSAFDRLSTLLLYNLNTQINDAHAWNKVIPEDDAALIAVVKETLAEAKDPGFNKQTPAQKMLIELQKKLKATQDLIEVRNKTVLELELNIASNTEKLNALKKDLSDIETQKTKSETELKELQKKSADDIAALKAEKTKVESQLTQAQADAKEAKTKLDAATADSTKTAQEKTELQTQSKDLAKKIEDLQEKKKDIEKNLDEVQHKRRELELQIEQAKFKQEQTENDRKKLAEENTKLDGVCKDLSGQVENKNKQALGLKVELERLRQKFAVQNKSTTKQTNKALNALRDDFEQQIHDLKIILLKQVNPGSEELIKEEAKFKAKQELEKQLTEGLIGEPEERTLPQPKRDATPATSHSAPPESVTPIAPLTPAPSTTDKSNAPQIEPVVALLPLPAIPTTGPAPALTGPTTSSTDDALAMLAKVASEPIKPLEPVKSSDSLPPVAALPNHLSKKDENPTSSAAETYKNELKKLEDSVTDDKNKNELAELAEKIEPVASMNLGQPVSSLLADQNKKELDDLEKNLTTLAKPGDLPPVAAI